MGKDSDRRTQLLRYAARTFLEKGYEATSMNLIAERARVTKPGLYYHFKSKQELLFSIMTYAMDSLEKEMRQATMEAGTHQQRLRNVIYRHARMLTEVDDGAFTMLVIDETKSLDEHDRRLIDHRKRNHFELVRAILAELEKEGRLRTGDPTVATFGLLGMVMWLSKWYLRDGPVAGRTVATQITEMALAAALIDSHREPGLTGEPS